MKNFAYRHYFSRVTGFSKGTKRTHRWFDPAAFARKCVASLLSGLLVFQPVLLQAQQLTPDVNAPIGNQPGVGVAPNGVPLVDIVTPNGQGLSHNKYGDFNVGNPGLILNNHNSELGTSKLGGVTPGNANLKNSGPASVILNEVTSGNRSALQGATEVFGGRADVIIANPNGITCDGCGFINTPRAALTTGTPDIDGTGHLTGFTVQGGDVTFGSKGANFASGDGAVDLFDIVSRRVQIDGPVNGKHLRLSAGRQKFDYATGEATALDGADDAGEFAIDGSALGAMQADRIKIVVTDKGAGVRMRNDMAANAGELTLSADGKISLGNASGRDGVSVQSKSRQVEAKKITSKKKVVVKAAKGITVEAVSADEDVILSTDTGLLSIAGDAASLGNIELTSSGAIVTGNVAAGKNASLQAGQGITAGQIIADGAVNLAATSGNIALSGTAKAGGSALTVTATSGSISAASLVSFNNMALTAGADIATGDILSGGTLIASARSVNAANVVSGVDFAATDAANGAIKLKTSGDMRIEATGAIDVASLLSAGNLNINGTALAARNVTSHGVTKIAGDTNVSGQILGGGNVDIAGANIKAGGILSGVDFAASQSALNGPIILSNSGNVTLAAVAGLIDVGTILSAGNVLADAATFKSGNVTSHGETNISGTTAISGQLLSGSDITIKGASIDLGTAVAGVDLNALANGNVVLANTSHALNLTATAGNLTAQRLLSSGAAFASATDNLSANALAHGDLDLTAGGTLRLSGQSLVGGNATLNAAALNLGTLVSGVDFAATEQSSGSLILKTGAPGTGIMVLNASNGSITADQLLSGGDLKAKAQQDITYNSLQSFGSADLNSLSGTISLDKNTVVKGDIALTLQSLDLSNDRSKLATAGTLIVNAASANLANSTLTFGGLTLNLSGIADASNAKIRAVTTDGGSGNIAITAQTITTTTATAILAANDLTLTLASLTNPGQLAANNNLTFNIAGNFTNTSTGLVYAGQDGHLYVAGDLLNDQGAILVGQDLIIAANSSGGRNQSITNVSGLIKAERDATITTANLTNKRSSVPTWSTVVVSNDAIAKFELNPETWGKPLGHIFANSATNAPLNLYPGEDYAELAWMAQLYGVITFSDGTSYRTQSLQSYDENTPWNWGKSLDSVAEMRSWLLSRYPGDGKGNILLTPDLQSKSVIIVNKSDPFAWTFTWDEGTQMRQSIVEQQFDSNLSPEALIQTGRNLNIDATILNNAYSSIEAGGNAKLTGSVLNNEGVALYRTVTSTCEATGGCEAYDANGNRDGVNDLDKGNSRVTGQSIVGGAFGNIKAAGNMDVSGFATVNNTSAEGSIAGGAQLSTAPATDDPTTILNGMTAGGALYTPNAALNGLSANGTPLVGDDLIAALGNSAPKPNSGGFGGTIPGQLFLYETRAEFLDVGKFYGSGYFINRIGYKPDREIPFLGDAYFENQLIDQQLRQLVNQGLGKGSFIPGSDAIEQMKTLLDRGVDFANAHGLTIGEKLSPELIANLTETMVWYEKKTVNGIEVLVPTVYIANVDKANLTVAGAIISGDTIDMNVGDVSNSGIIQAKTDLKLDATNITAMGGSFTAGNNVSLSASQNLTISAAEMQIGNETFVKSGSGVEAGGNASLAAGNDLSLRGAEVKAGNDVDLTGQTVTLDTAKATNNGSDNAIGTTVQSGKDTTITAKQDVNVIGSNVAAGGNLGIQAEEGSVNVVAAGVEKKVNGVAGTRMSQTDSTFAQTSNLSSGGDTSIKAGDDILISGSKVKAGGDASLEAKDDINITVAQQRTETIGSEVKQGSETHIGSEISSGGSVSVAAGDKADADNSHDLNIIGSKIDAKGKVDLSATDNVTIAEARDTGYSQLDTSSKGIFSKKESHSRTETETAVGSSISGGDGVDISSGKDTTISASNIQAGTADNKADLNIDAGGDLIIASGKDTVETDASKSKSGLLSKKSDKSHVYDETTVASELGASGNVNLNAGDNVVIAGSKVTAGDDIAIEGDSVSIIGAQEQHDASSSSKKSGLGAGSGDGFYSVWGKEEKSSKENIVANVGSQLSAGNDVSIKARETDVNIIGSHVQAGNDIVLEAGRDVNILPGAESYASEDKEKRSGFGVQLSSGNGSASIGIGFGSAKTEASEGAETNAVSSLSAGRDVIITAGRDANLQAAQVVAGSTVDILAERDVNLLSAQDKTNYEFMHQELFVGVTATVSSQAAAAVGNAYEAGKRVGEGSTANSIAMATIAGINGKYVYDTLVDGQPFKPGLLQNGPLLSTSLSVGFQYSKNSAEGSTSTPVPTTISAGDTVIIEAGRDINAVGAQVSAGYDQYGLLTGGSGDIALIAGNDINLESAKATTENSNKNVSGGASFDLLTNGVSFNYGQGKGNDTTVTNINTHVTGSGTVYVNSGNDTNLRGATVSGETVIADIGGDLNIESQLDTATAKANQVNVSGGVGTNAQGNMTGGISGSYQTAKGDAAIVSEQSGIHAGEGGFDIKVDGNTKLTGGLITSEADPENNRLETGTLEFEDLDTHSKWKADTYGGGFGASGPLVSPPIKEGESETGKALSAISPGEIIITDPNNQQQNIDDLRRDTTDTNTSLPGIPDLQKLLSEQLKTQQLYDDAAAKAAKMIGDYASDRFAEAYKNKNTEEMEFWKEGGTGPAILHAIAGGLLGGVTDFNGMLSGMLGGASSAYLAPKIKELVAEFVKEAGVTGSAADFMTNSITGSILQGLGGIAGGTGASYAGNAFQYNYLTHEQRAKEIEELKACNGDQNCLQTVARAYHELNVSQENELIACKTKECVDAIVASLADSAETLADDYQQLLKLSREAAESALTFQQMDIVTGQTDLTRDIAYAYFTAAFCEANPGDNCKRTGGLLYASNQSLVEAAYGALAGSRPRGTIKQDEINLNETAPATSKATAADVENYFQQNRQYWSSDPIVINGNKVYQRNDLIDPKYVDPKTGKTNLELMQSGRAPIGPDGNPINLHHMTQSQSGPIAELTQTFHQKNSGTIHVNTWDIPSGINRAEFAKWRREYWINRVNDF
ncbi:filamentous hemagglutinin family N-terminal domain protein (plasmid) [Ochrobactrum quorumnocens]|uniref:Filamentous hemagglutinin family N-terminal domain protein n=1 Tax=Ochrobactrum quorumnocens TaxID=271865 RepID=A0A248UM51_9HYPH|nr:hemagglutinin repeat-containing protein [[Ochrobactrum] quorumnocens]ASV87933.1 filamentous hemagglutinin family N-terminal domain protein [[Ochrobactrum] quorumnocens]